MKNLSRSSGDGFRRSIRSSRANGEGGGGGGGNREGEDGGGGGGMGR